MGKQIHPPKFIDDALWLIRKANIDKLIAQAKSRYISDENNLPFDHYAFEKYLVNDFFKVSLSYWRHMYSGRKRFSDNLIRHIEKRHDLAAGSLDSKNGVSTNSEEHFLTTILYVRKYFYHNKIEVKPEVENQLVKSLLSLPFDQHEISDEEFYLLLKSLT